MLGLCMCSTYSAVLKTSVKQLRKSMFYSVILVITLSFASQAFAGSGPILPDPTKLGPYATGFTTAIFTDTSRNRDGSTPTSGPAEGRPLYVAIWYPLQKACKTCQLAQYSINNPIYDGTHTGYPSLFLAGSITTSNGTVVNGLVNSGVFPLLIYSHGSTGSNAVTAFPVAETLASHGYVVASVEHTGNNSIRSVAIAGGLSGGPGMSTGSARLVRRAQDVSFVISQMLSNSSDPQFVNHIDPNAIGVYGYSYGGGTTTLTVAGFQSAGLAPDARVKAGVAMDGTDYVGLTATDYANVRVPLMLMQDSEQNQSNPPISEIENPIVFPQLINSPLKYLVDIAAAQHVPATDLNLCYLLKQSLQAVEANPLDPLTVGNGIFRASLGLIKNSYQYCQPSVFDGVSDATISLVGGDPAEVSAMKPLMPLRTATPLTEFHRLDKWYVVSFFNKTLKNQNGYDLYLSDSLLTRALNPLVEFSKNCRYRPDHLMDLQPGDMISYIPLIGKYYLITMSHGIAMLDKGTENLNLGDDASVEKILPFSFSMPNAGPFNDIKVNSNGAIVISSLIDSNIDLGFDYSGDSPWMTRGELMLNGQPTIAPLRNDLDPTAHGGIYYTADSNKAVITWDAVPMYASDGNGDQNTMQVVINKNGIINLIYGAMAQSGPDYQPDFIGSIGVATGKNDAIEVQIDDVDFSKLKFPIILPGAFEQFYQGTGGTPCN